VKVIDRHHRKPYFLYLPFNAAHVPLQATQKYLDRFPNLEGGRQMYAAMVSAMDDAVGAVLQKVKETGDEQNTLVFFLSDNGGAHGNTSTNGGLRADKSTVLEGGVRVPFFLKWPARLKAGQTSDVPVISIDIAATALAAAGVTPSADRKLDGVDILKSLASPEVANERPLFWRFLPQWAVRHGKWKLVSSDGTSAQLYDLSTDAREQTDLAANRPDVVAKLQAEWKAWESGNIPPRWPDGSNRARKRERTAIAPATAPNGGVDHE
jgi:arylsulfatase A-like enzyme